VVGVKDGKRLMDVEHVNPKDRESFSEADPDFMVWKAELNRELLSFWKSLQELYQE
jgi:hypothetical protein